MLGAAETTVVQGTGLGPDLRVPVPFVMARRRGHGTRFEALYEPYKGSPGVKEFLEPRPGVFNVVGTGWTDQIVAEHGKFSVVRSKL